VCERERETERERKTQRQRPMEECVDCHFAIRSKRDVSAPLLAGLKR